MKGLSAFLPHGRHRVCLAISWAGCWTPIPRGIRMSQNPEQSKIFHTTGRGLRMNPRRRSEQAERWALFCQACV